MQLWFPFQTYRKGQEQLAQTVQKSLIEKKHCIIHAPTGLGKTAGVLAAVLPFAKENKLNVFFLTARHTQHAIVHETMKLLNSLHDKSLHSSSIYGKKRMCALAGMDALPTSDFHELCKEMRANKDCPYYENTINNKPRFEMAVAKILEQPTATAEKILQEGINAYVCPYEAGIGVGKQSSVVISDYYYFFSTKIREGYLSKLNKKLSESIIIVDEAHNLPNRLQALFSKKIAETTFANAINEAKKYNEKLIRPLQELHSALLEAGEELRTDEDALVQRTLLTDALLPIMPFDDFIDQLKKTAEDALVKEKGSSLFRVCEFLDSWNEENEEGFIRLLKSEHLRGKKTITLSYKCIDSSIASASVLNEARSVVLISGTLQPLIMYRDILGFDDEKTAMQSFASPFPDKNRKVIIVPKTSTKYDTRSEEQYMAIGAVVSALINSIPGSSMVFFPSYKLRDAISEYIKNLDCVMLYEQQNSTNEEKQKLLNQLQTSLKATLLGVAAGSFGEGVDLPGVLKGVIIVGLPLDRPTVETKQIIAYYDRKFGKGWEYGYTLPAMTKCIQNVGRCIRSEKDKGVLIFLDERYLQPTYRNCLPQDWNIIITKEPIEEIENFFGMSE